MRVDIAADGCAFLATAYGAGSNERAGVFALERTLLLLLAVFVLEGLELRGEVAVTCGDAEEYTVEGLEPRGVVQNRNVGRLRRRAQLL